MTLAELTRDEVLPDAVATLVAEPAWEESPRTGRPPVAKPLGEQLVEAGIVSREQLQTALSKGTEKGMRLGEALLDMGFAEEDEILPYIERGLGLPATRLREGLIDPQVVRLIPQNLANALTCIALFKVRDTLVVAMSEPQNLQQTDEIERVTRLAVRP